MTPKPKKRILLAERPGAIDTASHALGSDFDLVLSTSLDHARQLLETPFDLIACGSHFDDCRMFDLLRYCKALPNTKPIPFLCLRVTGGALDDTAYQGVDIASRAFGAIGFVDLFRWREMFGHDRAHEELRSLVEMITCDNAL
jgi:hypothetical protein